MLTSTGLLPQQQRMQQQEIANEALLTQYRRAFMLRIRVAQFVDKLMLIEKYATGFLLRANSMRAIGIFADLASNEICSGVELGFRVGMHQLKLVGMGIWSCCLSLVTPLLMSTSSSISNNSIKLSAAERIRGNVAAGLRLCTKDGYHQQRFGFGFVQKLPHILTSSYNPALYFIFRSIVAKLLQDLVSEKILKEHRPGSTFSDANVLATIITISLNGVITKVLHDWVLKAGSYVVGGVGRCIGKFFNRWQIFGQSNYSIDSSGNSENYSGTLFAFSTTSTNVALEVVLLCSNFCISHFVLKTIEEARRTRDTSTRELQIRTELKQKYGLELLEPKVVSGEKRQTDENEVLGETVNNED